MNEFGKYRLFRKYASLDGVNYTPLDEYQALLVENNSCQCGYRELEYRFDGEYKEDTFKKYEIWKEYSFCPTDSSYDELTGNVDYRNPIANDGVMLATYLGKGNSSVKLYDKRFNDNYEIMAINNVELGKKTSTYKFNNTDINEVAYTNVTTISYLAFSSCNGLTSVIIPSSVKSIGNQAFYNCTSLTSVTIPNSVISIGESAFYSTPFYDNLPNGDVYLGSCYYNYKGTMQSNTSITIKDGTKSIGYGAFQGYKNLTSVTIADSVTSIGNYCFKSCTSLTSVTIPNSVKDIGEHSFDSCSGLTSVTIGSGLTSIGSYSFQYCSRLTSITCFSTTAPSFSGSGSFVFYGLPTNGTLHVPQGSDYSIWLRQLPSGWTIEYI